MICQLKKGKIRLSFSRLTPCNVAPLFELHVTNLPLLDGGEGDGCGLICSPKLPHMRKVSQKVFFFFADCSLSSISFGVHFEYLK